MYAIVTSQVRIGRQCRRFGINERFLNHFMHSFENYDLIIYFTTPTLREGCNGSGLLHVLLVHQLTVRNERIQRDWVVVRGIYLEKFEIFQIFLFNFSILKIPPFPSPSTTIPSPHNLEPYSIIFTAFMAPVLSDDACDNISISLDGMTSSPPVAVCCGLDRR